MLCKTRRTIELQRCDFVGLKLVEFKVPKLKQKMLNKKTPYFAANAAKIRCFSNYLGNLTATQGHSHSLIVTCTLK